MNEEIKIFDLIKQIKELENEMIPDEYHKLKKEEINFGDEKILKEMIEKGNISLIKGISKLNLKKKSEKNVRKINPIQKTF
jgi:hypothetical protein